MPRASIYSSFMSPIIKVVIHKPYKEHIFNSDDSPEIVYNTLKKYKLPEDVLDEITVFFDNTPVKLGEQFNDEDIIDLDLEVQNIIPNGVEIHSEKI